MADSGITNEYLEKALGFPVDRFEVKAGSNLGDGYTCAMFGANVWKKSDPSTPISIVIKCYPANQTRQDILESTSVFQIELEMYDAIIPAIEKFQEFLPLNDRVALPFAPFIFGQYVKPEDRPKLGRPLEPLDNSIVMPDLRKPENGPFLLRDRFLGFDFDHYRLVIEGQAKLHAISWAYKCRKGRKNLIGDFPILDGDIGQGFGKAVAIMTPPGFGLNEKLFQDNPKILAGLEHLKNVIYSVLGLYYDYDAGQSEKGHTKDNILRKPGRVSENEEPWEVLLHGDCWSNNLMFRYDEKTGKPVEVIFIDLQICRESDPMNDIVYGLYFNAQPDLRRKHLQSILHIYFDTFTEVCKKFDVPPLPGWSWEEFSRRFHRAKIMGGFVGVLFMHSILKKTDDLENLDDAMAKAEDSADASKDPMEALGDMFATGTSPEDLHPAVKARMSALLQELVEDGII